MIRAYVDNTRARSVDVRGGTVVIIGDGWRKRNLQTVLQTLQISVYN